MKIYLRKDRFQKGMLYILFFYALYFPNLFGQISPLFNHYVIYLVIFVSLLVFLRKYRGYFIQMIQDRDAAAYVAGIIVSSFYVAFRASLTDISLFDIKSMRLIQSNFPILCFLLVLMIIAVLYHWGYTFEKGLDLLFKIASIQGIICLMMLLSPGLKSFADHLYLKDATQFNQDSYILIWRIFGICSDYTYGTPIVNGIVTGICFYYALSKNRKYFLYASLIFIAAILNSRTGVLVAIITVCLGILYSIVQRGILRKSMAVLLILPTILILLITLVASFNKGMMWQQTAMFKEIYAFFFKGETQGTVDILLNSHLNFPKGADLIFGAGHRVYLASEAQGEFTSDIGFVNDMFMGGLIYLLMRYSAIAYITLKAAKKSGVPFIGAALCITWLIANFKGQVTANLAFTFFWSYIIGIALFLPHTRDVTKDPRQTRIV